MYIRCASNQNFGMQKDCAFEAGSVTGNDRNRPAEHRAATVAVLVMGLSAWVSLPDFSSLAACAQSREVRTSNTHAAVVAFMSEEAGLGPA